MSLDVILALAFAGGEPHNPAPVSVEGVQVEPSITTRSSQATGTGATVMVARYTGGRVRIGKKVLDVHATETTITNKTSYMTSGQAQWATLVAFQHAPAGAVSLGWVKGTIAAVASAVVPTMDEIKAALQLGDYGVFAVCGDVRFHRDADTTLSMKTTGERRPAFVDEDDKTSFEADQADLSTLGERFWGFVDIAIDLTSASAVTPGAQYAQDVALPRLPYGGRVGTAQYIGSKAGAGTGASIVVTPTIGTTNITGSGITLTLAASALPSTIAGGDPSAANTFGPGTEVCGLEVTTVTTAFTAGTGLVRLPIFEKVAA